jgi:hypothetical protein
MARHEREKMTISLSRKNALRTIYVCAFVAMLLLNQTKPEIDDYIEVRSIKVVTLKKPTKQHNGCYSGSGESSEISVGDPLFVKADVSFLTGTPGQYRTQMRNETIKKAVYNDQDWSQKIPYTVETQYCRYHSLAWWIGREKAPELSPGANLLYTSYRFENDAGQAVSREFKSQIFILEDTNEEDKRSHNPL